MRRGWKAICDRCGFEFYANQLRKEWQGLMTCSSCWEPRHPQEFVKVTEDKQSVPWSRPEPADVFVPYCTMAGSSCYTGLAIAGCAIAGNNTYLNTLLLNTFGPEYASVTPAYELLLTESGEIFITDDGDTIVV